MRHAAAAIVFIFGVSAIHADDNPCSTFGEVGLTIKKAVLVGNYDYENIDPDHTLSSKEDLEGMQQQLTQLGYSGVVCKNVANGDFSKYVLPFVTYPGTPLNDGDILLFYYSGHGLEINGTNYLLGNDARNFSDTKNLFDLPQILDVMDARRIGINVVIIDACRTPPSMKKEKGYAKPRPSGFVAATAPKGTYVAFASEPHMPAQFGTKGNMSPFTEAVVAELAEHAEDDIDFFFRRVRARVAAQKRSVAQKPWTEHALTGAFSIGDGYNVEGKHPPAATDREIVKAQTDKLCSGLDAVRARVIQKDVIAPMFFASDLMRLELCAGGNDDAVRLIHDALSTDEYRLWQMPRSEVRMAVDVSEAPTSLDTCDPMDAKRCTYDMIVRKDVLDARKGIPGGGKLWFDFPHWGKLGHYEITAAALRQFDPTIQSQAVKIMADAAQDADFYEWGHPEAHGQTSYLARGKAGDVGASQRAFATWISDHIGKFRDSCANQKYRNAAYWAGYTMHGIQDVVFHRGITNPEHAYRDFAEHVGIDTDEDYDKKVSLAKKASVRYLQRVAAATPDCWTKLSNVNEPWLSRPDKESLGLSYDFTPTASVAYRALSTFVKIALPFAGEDFFFIKKKWFELDDENSLWSLLDPSMPAAVTIPSAAPVQ
jgi:hypothetical protein